MNLLGGFGYIGGCYHKMYGGERNEKTDLSPKQNQVLYFISTVSNHTFLTDPYRDIDTNLTTLVKVLESMKDMDGAEFNFISSGFVYGECDKPKTESDPCEPKGFYSSTKRCAEQLVKYYCEAHGIKYRIIRLCNVIGGFDDKASEKKNAIHFMVRQVIQNKMPVLHLNHPDEKVERQYMDVSDICRAINMIVNKGGHNENFNISWGDVVSQKELLDYAHHSLNMNPKYGFQKRDEFAESIHLKKVELCNQKLRDLGFTANLSPYDIIDELIERETK